MSKILTLKLDELIIDNSLSGRSEKERKDNAKRIQGMIEATGSWPPSMPGEVFKRGKEYHLRAGFSRALACQNLGYETGFFIEVEDSPQDNLLACIRTNAGAPISRKEQGRIYAQMRDGSNPETLAVGEVAMEPMTLDAIAGAVGLTKTAIEGSICIYEETPEIGELIESGVVANNVVIKAKQWVKDDGKRLRFLKAAIRAAEADEKACATMKHLESVKADFVPLKAAPAKKTQDAPERHDDRPAASDARKDDDTHTNSEPEKEQPSLLDLGSTAPAPAKKVVKAYKEQLATVIDAWGAEDAANVVFTEEERDDLIERIMALGMPI